MASSPAPAPTDLHCRPTTAHHGDRRVGLLYIIYSHQATSDGRSLSYLQQALRSVRTVSKHNPELPTALATNLLQSAGAAEAVLRGPAGNGSFTLACDMHGQQPGENHWSPRLRALRSAPFELTLEVDASVTVCSPQLHGALLAEWTRDRLDFAVNFEMVQLSPPSPGSTVGPPPHGRGRVGALLQHADPPWTRRARAAAAVAHAVRPPPSPGRPAEPAHIAACPACERLPLMRQRRLRAGARHEVDRSGRSDQVAGQARAWLAECVAGVHEADLGRPPVAPLARAAAHSARVQPLDLRLAQRGRAALAADGAERPRPAVPGGHAAC